MTGANFSLEINDIIADIEIKTGVKVVAKRMETTKSKKGGYPLNNVLITVEEYQAKEVKNERDFKPRHLLEKPEKHSVTTAKSSGTLRDTN